MNKIFFLVFSFVITLSGQDNISKYLEGITGCFVLYDFNKNEYIRYNEERCKLRFLPASTFKIPNSLIALAIKLLEIE